MTKTLAIKNMFQEQKEHMSKELKYGNNVSQDKEFQYRDRVMKRKQIETLKLKGTTTKEIFTTEDQQRKTGRGKNQQTH